MAGADPHLHVASLSEQTDALLGVVDQHEDDIEGPADRLVLEVDGQWTAELSGHTEAVRVRLGSRARSVILRDERGALRAFLMIDELDVAGEAGATVRPFDRGRIGLVLRRRPGGLELEVRTGTKASIIGRPGPERAVGGASFHAAEGEADYDPPPSSTLLQRSIANGSDGFSPPDPPSPADSSGALLHSPPMLEDELGGQVSAVRPADEEGAREGTRTSPPPRRRLQGHAMVAPGRLVRVVLAAAAVAGATAGVLWYQQVRFERQMAADLADRKRLELERARLEREKAETERRIGELRKDLRLAKDEAERARLEAEIERERAKVDPSRAEAAAPSSGAADRSGSCKPGQPGCLD